MDAVTAGRETARTAALRAAAAADGGVKGDGGLVVVIGGSRAYAAPLVNRVVRPGAQILEVSCLGWLALILLGAGLGLSVVVSIGIGQQGVDPKDAGTSAGGDSGGVFGL